MSNFAISLGLILANSGSTPTFRRGDANSIIDITYYRGVDLPRWEVLDTESLSDHNYVFFCSASPHRIPVPIDPPPEAHPGWSAKKINTEALYTFLGATNLEQIAGDPSASKAIDSARSLDAYLTAACEVSMPRRKAGLPRRSPVY